MVEFKSYDSLDEAFADMARMEHRAIAALTPAQWELVRRTDTFRCVYSSEGLTMFGEVPSLNDTIAAERACYPTPHDADTRAEIRSTVASLTDSRSRGYLFGSWFSAACPSGELGSVHASRVIQEIDLATFHEWYERGWR